MVFLKLQENLSQSIEILEKRNAGSPVFSVYSHISGDTDNTAEITLILDPKTQNSVKNKIEIKDVDKYFDTCVRKSNMPNPEDKMFKKMVNFFIQNRKEYEIPREKLLYLLKRQDAGLTQKKWITQNVLYSFNYPDNPTANVIQSDTETAYCTLICAYGMREDGLLLMMEEKLNKILQEKYSGTEGIPENLEEEKESVPKEEPEVEKIEEKTEVVPKVEKSGDPPKDIIVSKENDESTDQQERKIVKKTKSVQKMGLFGPVLTTRKGTTEPEDEKKSTEKNDKEQNSVEDQLTAAEKQKLARKRLAERRMRRKAKK